jgi:hypothetical protein
MKVKAQADKSMFSLPYECGTILPGLRRLFTKHYQRLLWMALGIAGGLWIGFRLVDAGYRI